MFSVCCWIACSFVLLLVVDGFFFCVFSFWLAFRFALFLVRISVLIAFPVCSVSVPEHGMQKAPRHSGADRFPNRFAATGVTGAISIRWPAQNHLRYRTVAWKTIHSPGGSIWSIWFGTAWPSAAAFLLLDRYRVQMIRYGPSPISDSMDGSFRYRSLEVHVVSMDHPVPYLVLDRYIGKWADPRYRFG